MILMLLAVAVVLVTSVAEAARPTGPRMRLGQSATISDEIRVSMPEVKPYTPGVVKSGAEKIVVNDSANVRFAFQDVNGNQVIRTYGFTKDGQGVRQENKFIGFQPTAYELAWKGGLKETEDIPKSKGFLGIGGGSTYYFSEVVFNNRYSVEREMPREMTSFNATEGKVIWAGLRRKYVAMTVQFDEAVPATLKTKPMKVEGNEVDPGTYKLTIADDFRGTPSLSYNLIL